MTPKLGRARVRAHEQRRLLRPRSRPRSTTTASATSPTTRPRRSPGCSSAAGSPTGHGHRPRLRLRDPRRRACPTSATTCSASTSPPDMLELAERNAPRASSATSRSSTRRSRRRSRSPRSARRSTTRPTRAPGSTRPTTVARRVYDALAPGGVFLFDVATPGRNLGLEVRERIHDHDDWMLMHAGRRRPATSSTGASRSTRREPDGRYTRIDEHHVIHLYDPDALRALLDGRSASTVETRPSYGATRRTPRRRGLDRVRRDEAGELSR